MSLILTLKNILKIFYQFLLNKNIFHLELNVSEKNISKFFNLIHKHFIGVELIRVGGKGDGGYLIPNDFTDIEFCFSPGVSYNASFEKDLIDKGIDCYLADNSVDKAPIVSDKITFIKKHIGVMDNDLYTTMDTWINSNTLKHKGLGILQMDIEGSEYPALLSMSLENLNKFKYIIIEFHDLHQLFNSIGYDVIFSTFSKVLSQFNIVHIHPNNVFKSISCYEFEIFPIMEFTFVNKSYNINKPYLPTFPHQLDHKNVISKKEAVLPKCWHPF